MSSCFIYYKDLEPINLNLVREVLIMKYMIRFTFENNIRVYWEFGKDNDELNRVYKRIKHLGTNLEQD
jgi:hypothetical protein